MSLVKRGLLRRAVLAGWGKAGIQCRRSDSDIWVDDLARGVRMRLTNDPGTDHGIPVWSPDGSRILFGALCGQGPAGHLPEALQRGRRRGAAAGVGDLRSADMAHELVPRRQIYPLLAGRSCGLTHAEIWVLPLAGDRKPRLFVQTPVAAYDGQFSPDGRWVAYTSKESGREEVYVVPFEAAKVLNTGPGSATSPGGKWQISPSGGRFPRWRRDGKEIFYFVAGQPDDGSGSRGEGQ